jgi:hypothetical protein
MKNLEPLRIEARLSFFWRRDDATQLCAIIAHAENGEPAHRLADMSGNDSGSCVSFVGIYAMPLSLRQTYFPIIPCANSIRGAKRSYIQ